MGNRCFHGNQLVHGHRHKVHSHLFRAKRMAMDKNSYRWLENELRIFVWSLVLYASSKNIDIEHMVRPQLI